MTKKFMAMLLSLVMIIGLMPAMSISVLAQDATEYRYDDFESYDLGKLTPGSSSYLTIDGNNSWRINASLNAEIVEVTGADGKKTKAMKYTNNAGNSQNITNNVYRLTACQVPGATAAASMAGNLFVQEFKVWFPSDIEVDSGIDKKRPTNVNMSRISVSDTIIFDGKSTGATVPDETWVKITIVTDYTDYAAKGDPITYAIYKDDQCVYYNEDNKDNISIPNAQANYFIVKASGNSSTATDAVGDFNDMYFLLDDVNYYYGPAATTASSTFAGEEDLSVSTNPVVNFSNMILNTTVSSDCSISAEENVEFIKVSDSSGVPIESIEVSSDNKSLTINPGQILEKGEQYKVTVKGIKDMYGRKIADYSFTFTTMEASYISLTAAPVFTKEALFAPGGSGTLIDSLSNGYINTTFTVTNTHASEAKGTILMVVLKENDEIKYFQFEEGDVAPNGTLTFNGGFYVDDAANQVIETYVWNSLYGMTPLADKYVISSSGISSTEADAQ